jgi:acetate kinase
MRILVLNRGSSSLKCAFYEGEKCLKEVHLEGSYRLKEVILSLGIKPQGIGHRIVHGGKFYRESVLIDEGVKKNIRALGELAPLHNRADLEGIEVMEKLFPGIPQVAVFDTAFHRTLGEVARIYPGPYAWFEGGIERYGFHGISFQYSSKKAASMLGLELSTLKIIICHLGAGASLCAIKEGHSIDTTMGFTPLEGLVMDTRCGSIDPGILLYLLSKKNKEELSRELYEASGLLGLSGVSGDMREIMKKKGEGHERAILAFEVYLHRLKAGIGAMMASLEGLDVLVFTGGIGENNILLRQRVCESFSFLGLKLDLKKNENSTEAELSLPDSRVKVLLVHTEESLEIARECQGILSTL